MTTTAVQHLSPSKTDAEVLLECSALSKNFRTQDIETAALAGIDFRMHQGDFVSVMGPSGCGKSTLLNIVGMLDSPSDGSYRFKDEEISKYGERKLAELRKKSIGFVFQSFNLIDEMTVFENVELALLYHDIPRKCRKEMIDKALERLAMSHRKMHYPNQLSGGQQQRVAVARALVSEPDLILADEPTGNLDSRNGEKVMEILDQLHKEGTSILMVTHSEHHASYADRVVNLLDGRVVSTQQSSVRSFI